jgi:hypothetical protein
MILECENVLCRLQDAYETKVITTYERLRDAQVMVGMKDRSWQENLNLINSSVRQDKTEWAMNIIEPAWDKAKSFTDNVARLKEQLNLLQAIPEPDRDVKWRNRLQEMTQTWNIVKMGDPEAVALYQAALPEGMARAAYTVDPIGSEICEKIAVSTEELAVYFGVDPSTATTLGNTIAFVVPFGLGTKIQKGTKVLGSLGKTILAGELTARKLPGVALKSAHLTNPEMVLRGTHNNVGIIPLEVANKMVGKNYSNFDAFRKDFWKNMADSSYAKEFAPTDIIKMQKGLSPESNPSQWLGSRKSFELHHRTPIHAGGSVYDLSNILIVTPRYHQEILSKATHYGK